MTPEAMHADELSISKSLVSELLAENFPDLSLLPLAALQSSGTVNVIFRLGTELCVRLPRAERFANSLSRELAWIPGVQSTNDISVPRVFAEGKPHRNFPLPWAIMHWLPGKPVEPGSAGESHASAVRLANFLCELKRREVNSGPSSNRDRPPVHGAPLITEAFDVLEHQGWPLAELKALWQACVDCPRYAGEATWTHGDLIPPNLLEAEGEISAVIDFGSYALGDPAVDLIPAWTIFRGAARQTFLETMAMDQVSIERARGYALRQALQIIPYYQQSNPPFVQMAEAILNELINDQRG